MPKKNRRKKRKREWIKHAFESILRTSGSYTYEISAFGKYVLDPRTQNTAVRVSLAQY